MYKCIVFPGDLSEAEIQSFRCVCVCVCVCVYVYIYTHTSHTCIYVHTNIYASMYTHLQYCPCTFFAREIQTYGCVCVCICIYLYLYIQNYIYLYLHIQIYCGTCVLSESGSCVCIRAFVYINISCVYTSCDTDSITCILFKGGRVEHPQPVPLTEILKSQLATNTLHKTTVKLTCEKSRSQTVPYTPTHRHSV